MDALYSILIANYNRGKYIKETLESVLSQDYPQIEVVVVDDGSTDNSQEIIRQFLVDHRLRFFQNANNKGCGSAMKRCAELCRGDYFGFVGSDDVLLPGAISSVMKHHVDLPGCSIIHTNHYVCDEELKVQRLAYGAGKIPEGESYLSNGTGITAFASFTRKHYFLTRGADETFKRAVDQDMYYKLEEVGNVYFINEPFVKYRINPEGISTNRNISKARYWLVRAKENAFERRKDRPSAKNIDQKELNAWWSIVYVTKSSEAFRQLSVCKGFYWLVKSLRRSLWDRHFKLKIKSFFLNTWFHKLFKGFQGAW